MNLVEIYLALPYSVIVKVIYAGQRIQCSMREQSTLRSHYVREVIAKGDVKVCKISTHDNASDMITKPVLAAKCELCLDLIGISR
jgi:hypothetical protein